MSVHPLTNASPGDRKVQSKASIFVSQRCSFIVEVFRVLLLLLLTVLLLECLFMFTGVGEQDFLKPDAALGSAHIPGKLVTWRVEGYSSDRFSEAGWRDVNRSIEKPPKTYRIALIGDSQTEALQVPMKDDWASRAERQLKPLDGYENVEVLNFGVSSYGTGQELLLLKRHVMQYQPDLVVLLYLPFDKQENFVEPSNRLKAEPRPFFYLNEAGELKLDDSVMANHSEVFRTNPLLDFARLHSRIYGIYQHTSLTLYSNDKFYANCRDFVVKLIGRIWRKPKSTRLAPQYPSQDGLKVTQAIIREIHSVARKHNSDFLLMTYPDLVTIDPSYSAQLDSIRSQSKAEGFDMIELTKPFRDSKEPESLFYKVHFAQAGNDITASVLSEYVKKKIETAKP